MFKILNGRFVRFAALKLVACSILESELSEIPGFSCSCRGKEAKGLQFHLLVPWRRGSFAEIGQLGGKRGRWIGI